MFSKYLLSAFYNYAENGIERKRIESILYTSDYGLGYTEVGL